MEFSPDNDVVKLCIQAMAREEKGEAEEAKRLFLQAWNESTNDFEKFLAAYYVARHQENVPDKLGWHETALRLALEVNDESVKCYTNVSTSFSLPGLLKMTRMLQTKNFLVTQHAHIEARHH